MKTKIFLFFFVLCNVICLSCSEDEDVTTNLENNEYIALKPDESLFRNKDNIQKLIIAKRRFDEFVYLDENDKYQVKLENGKSINISNDLFSFLKETLSSRNKKFEDEYKLGRSQARFAWRDPYAVSVESIRLYLPAAFSCGEEVLVVLLDFIQENTLHLYMIGIMHGAMKV